MPDWNVITGRIEDVLPTVEAESFDGCACDPPYGLKFMGKAWDHGVPGPEIWREVLRCLKPGAFLLAFGGTRTFHRLTCAIEDAGFEIRDCACFLYGGGFPKSLNISAAIDRAAGAEREVLPGASSGCAPDGSAYGAGLNVGFRDRAGSLPATDAARTWEGYGTALKPAWEPCIVAMKPLDGTFAANALRHGVAGLNVDGCRIEGEKNVPSSPSNRGTLGWTSGDFERKAIQNGRWPANVILDEEAAELLDRQSGFLAPGNHPGRREGIGFTKAGGGKNSGTESGINVSTETGGASRFFYTSKVRPEERNLGGIDCRHPTLKPLDLCEYLARLILPPKRPDAPRRLLVPFAGAGSEICGALEAGWEDVVGIEMEEQSAEWARARIAALLSTNPAERTGRRDDAGQVLQRGLFE